MKKKIKNRGWN